MIKAIIVDDERLARENLMKHLHKHCPQVEVVALCQDVIEAKVAILEKDPFLVFLDVKMPNATGLEMLKSLPNRSFVVVFVTAYAEFALEAFEEAAVDYVLKPIHSDRLKKAVKRVQDRFETENRKGRGDQEKKLSSIIPLPTADGVELFESDEIERFQAQGNYTLVHLVNGERVLISKNLKKIEDLVESSHFARIHHAHLVNILHVKRYSRVDGGFLIMKSGAEVEVSRRKKTHLLQLLGLSQQD